MTCAVIIQKQEKAEAEAEKAAIKVGMTIRLWLSAIKKKQSKPNERHLRWRNEFALKFKEPVLFYGHHFHCSI